MSAYTCIFTRAGQQLSTIVGRKRMIQSRDAGVQFNPPITIFNNPGQFVYPGGRVNQGETALNAALREFREETGINFVLNQQQTQVQFNLINCRILVQAMNGFSCAFIKAQTLQDLQALNNAINQNIGGNVPVSDELQDAQILQLQNYAGPRVATQAITNYCNQNVAQLRTLRTLAQWRAFLNGGQIVVPSPVPTTQAGVNQPAPGVLQFSQQCYDMGPFMDFIRNPNPPVNFDFPANQNNQRQYAFLRQNENLPGRFSTDWFTQISERIPAVDALMV